jgi:large subunit ribosomal protein L35
LLRAFEIPSAGESCWNSRKSAAVEENFLPAEEKVLYNAPGAAMPCGSMLKTRKAVAKRFKFTATGKVLRRTAGYAHLLRNKSTKSQRRSRGDKAVSPGFSAQVRRAVPFA